MSIDSISQENTTKLAGHRGGWRRRRTSDRVRALRQAWNSAAAVSPHGGDHLLHLRGRARRRAEVRGKQVLADYAPIGGKIAVFDRFREICPRRIAADCCTCELKVSRCLISRNDAPDRQNSLTRNIAQNRIETTSIFWSAAWDHELGS